MLDGSLRPAAQVHHLGECEATWVQADPGAIAGSVPGRGT